MQFRYAFVYSERRPGRPVELPPEVRARSKAEHRAGRPLRRIAAGLNLDGVPTAHGGRRWWASTVRAVLSSATAEVRSRPTRRRDSANRMDASDQEEA